MEAALRRFLQNSLGDYVSGGLTVDASRFPLTLRDLRLNERKIQTEIDDDSGGATPFHLSGGCIGCVSVDVGWSGVEIRVTDVVLNLSFSPSRAVRWATGQREPKDAGDAEHASAEAAAPPPPAPSPVAPRYCTAHASSSQRAKAEPQQRECTACGGRLQTNYAEFALCPPCSDRERRCMICGGAAPLAGAYTPPACAAAVTRTAAAPGRDEAQGGPTTPFAAAACEAEQSDSLYTARTQGDPMQSARYCQSHAVPELRAKGRLRWRTCGGCWARTQTSYLDFELCPACSDAQGRCLLCGESLPTAPLPLPPPPLPTLLPPRWSSEHAEAFGDRAPDFCTGGLETSKPGRVDTSGPADDRGGLGWRRVQGGIPQPPHPPQAPPRSPFADPEDPQCPSDSASHEAPCRMEPAQPKPRPQHKSHWRAQQQQHNQQLEQQVPQTRLRQRQEPAQAQEELESAEIPSEGDEEPFAPPQLPLRPLPEGSFRDADIPSMSPGADCRAMGCGLPSCGLPAGGVLGFFRALQRPAP